MGWYLDEGYEVELGLIKGKRVSGLNLLKSLSLYFQLEGKVKQMEEKVLQALFEGATLANSKLVKRELQILSPQKVECPIGDIHNFYEKITNFPVLKDLCGTRKRRRFDQLPIEHGINYWYLFNQQTPKEPFELDITQIKP